MLFNFPFDVIVNILDLLTIQDIVKLRLVNKSFDKLIKEYGFKLYFTNQKWNMIISNLNLQKQHPSSSSSLNDNWQKKVSFGYITHQNWKKKLFSSTIIMKNGQSLIPTLKFDKEKLLISMGNCIEIFYFNKNSYGDFNYKKRNFEWFIAHNNDITDILLSGGNDDEIIYTSSVDNTIKKWNIKKLNHNNHYYNNRSDYNRPLTHKKLFKGHQNSVQSIYAFPDDSLNLYSVGFDGTLRMWNTETTQNKLEIPLPGRPRIIRGLSSKNNLIGVGNRSKEHFTLYYVTPNDLVKHATGIKEHQSTVYAIASNQNIPNTFVTGCYDGICRLFDVRTMQCVASYRDPYDYHPVFSVDYDAYRMAAGASRNGIIRIFDLRYNKNNYQELKKGVRKNDGWSLYLGNNRSPVYSLQMEHSKIFAALSNMTWMLDFSKDKMNNNNNSCLQYAHSKKWLG
ncbi:WD40-repeat-containing domain protein [Glomus cerebriforme]|uniref:WD40-repeat-containing domain protein n=1 Tax=Glomus cerebriforme TaxID=658196 RepID=A0A397TCN0_9GLOM|nr:WD40-repeat-containing domain protein [Glomus cerebriforme]